MKVKNLTLPGISYNGIGKKTKLEYIREGKTRDKISKEIIIMVWHKDHETIRVEISH